METDIGKNEKTFGNNETCENDEQRGLVIKHLATALSSDMVKKLAHIQPHDSWVKKALNDLLTYTQQDLKNRIPIYKEVKVWFNPTQKDMQKWTQKARDDYWRNKAARDKLYKSGRLGGNGCFANAGQRCYRHTLAFLVTKKQEHANMVLKIISAWSTQCKSFGVLEENGPLEVSWGIASMAQSMEILQHTFKIPSNVQNSFKNFYYNVLFKNLTHFDENGVMEHFASKGNWGTSIVHARLLMAIYNNDTTEIEYCKRNALLMFNNIFLEDTGKTTETLRDLVHAQMGLGGMIGYLEVFYNQGLDLYSTRNNILFRSLEFHASILLGEVPPGINRKDISAPKFVSSNWEIAYNHYANRKKMPMPHTKALLERSRPETMIFQFGMGTLTHYGTRFVK